MKWAALLTAITNLLLRVVEILGEGQSRRRRVDYEQDVEDIRSDPVGYANHKFGGVRDAEAEASDMHGNDPAGAGYPVPQRPGNHPD